MVKGHLQQATTTATGIAIPATVEKPFAITQATWRFLDNDRVTPLGLVEPLRHFAPNSNSLAQSISSPRHRLV
jgi:hypothetical protein